MQEIEHGFWSQRLYFSNDMTIYSIEVLDLMLYAYDEMEIKRNHYGALPSKVKKMLKFQKKTENQSAPFLLNDTV